MATPTTPQHIVVVDDDPDTLHLMQIMLGPYYAVTVTDDPTQALDLIHNVKPDLVLLDLMMPDVDGWTLYNAIREDEATARLPVIIITAKTDTLDKVLGLRVAQVDGYLNKPFSQAELLTMVQSVLDSRITHSG